jgi:hypothetical protein
MRFTSSHAIGERRWTGASSSSMTVETAGLPGVGGPAAPVIGDHPRRRGARRGRRVPRSPRPDGPARNAPARRAPPRCPAARRRAGPPRAASASPDCARPPTRPSVRPQRPPARLRPRRDADGRPPTDPLVAGGRAGPPRCRGRHEDARRWPSPRPSGRQLGATTATTVADDRAAASRAHARTEAVLARSPAIVGLEGALRHDGCLPRIGVDECTRRSGPDGATRGTPDGPRLTGEGDADLHRCDGVRGAYRPVRPDGNRRAAAVRPTAATPRTT